MKVQSDDLSDDGLVEFDAIHPEDTELAQGLLNVSERPVPFVNEVFYLSA
jgi:hypothetical protein